MSATIRQIAQRTGYSTAAVSQALRGLGRLSEAVRKNIRDTASEMGYLPDPALARTLSRMRKSNVTRYRETIAFVTEWGLSAGPGHHLQIHEGAARQAENMGYKIENFPVSGRPKEQHRLNDILQARGIRGVIVLPRLGNAYPRLHFDWKNFAAVEIGRTLWHPRTLHRVETSNYHKTVEAIHLLKRVGYRRIGMAIEPAQNGHQRGTYYAAFLLSQLRLPARERIPVLATAGPWEEKTFRAWVRKHKPDVLIVHAVIAPRISEWLEGLKLRVPEDISLFCVNIQDHKTEPWSGLRRDFDSIGASAVEMITLLLLDEMLGAAHNPRCLQIDEFWVPGKTLRRSIREYITPDGFLRPALLRYKAELRILNPVFCAKRATPG